MGVLLTLIAGLVVWIVLWALGSKAFDAFMITVLVALLVCLIPTTIGGLLSAIGIAGMDRMIRANVIAMSGRAVEATWSGIVLMGEDQAETERLASERADRGVPPGDLTAPAEAVVERLGELSAAGASWAILLLAGPPDRRALFAEHVLPALR